MKKLLVSIVFLACSPAYADISDSGNLVIGGTATIQGNSFSVGGSTLSVSQGTVTAGGLLQLSGSGIKFGDGTTQTTAASDSFGSTVTIGPSIYSTTASYAAVLRGGWSIVASTRLVNNTASVLFTSLNSSYTHRWTFNLRWGTGGALQLRINNDSSSRYRWDEVNMGSDGTPADFSNNNTSLIALTAGQTVGNGGPAGLILGTRGNFECSALPNGRSDVNCAGITSYANTTDTGFRKSLWNGHKMPSTTWTSLLLFASAGNFTGEVYVEALVPPIDP